jgi:signal transduction histidine kinase
MFRLRPVLWIMAAAVPLRPHWNWTRAPSCQRAETRAVAMGWARAAARLLAGVIVGACIAAWPVSAAEEPARVLILNALDPYLPAYLAIDGPMRANLVSETGRRIVLFSEPLDAQRFAVEPLEPELLALLTKKYRALPIDVVVTVTKPAFDFYVRHGHKLWPGSRLVFHGLPDPGNQLPTVPPGAVGLVNRDDFGGTLDLARRLQPDARRVLVVSGVSPLDRELEDRARQTVPAVAGAAAVEFLTGLPLAELLARVAKEPADTIILYLSQFRDRDDRPYLPREVLRAMSEVSAAPIYGLFETYVGSGVAAGSMEFYADRGRVVAQLVRDTVAGKPPAQAISSVPSRCVADARALKRWSLDERRLPDGCDIRFVERPAWRQYLWQIVLALAVLVGQSLLIIGLFAQRRRRRIAEAESRSRLSAMAHMNRSVAMGGLAASIAHELNQPLGAIYNNASAAQLLIKNDPPNLDEVAEILNDIKLDDKRASEVLVRIRNMLGKTATKVEALDLNEAIGETMKLLAAEALAKGVAMRAELEPGLPQVRADRVQVQQVILNLVLNAIEAMADPPAPKRQVLVRSRRCGDHQAEVCVSDSGAGIAPDMLPRIFDAFVTAKPGGMGLGLSISRSIVEAHGGRLVAANQPEGGASFRFTLPFATAAAA